MSNKISQIISSALSSYINNDIVISYSNGHFKYSISISEYFIEIYYDIIDSFYRIKIENWHYGTLQNVSFLTQSKKYKKTIKNMLKSQNFKKNILRIIFCVLPC